MPDSTPAWRDVDGDVVPGRQRLIFIRDDRGHYTLGPVTVFADGVVSWNYGRAAGIDGLRAALDEGTLTVTPPAGTRVSVPGAGPVEIPDEARRWTAAMVAGDLADELDRLNDRPDSPDRAYRAFAAYAADPTEELLEVARAAYQEIPEHRRIYFLGDMDRNDVPARILLAPPGAEIQARNPGTRLTVTAAVRAEALDYFRRQEAGIDRMRARDAADGPDTAAAVPFTVRPTVYPRGWPDPPGLEVLQNDYPVTVVHRDRSYPSVTHAYWALSTSDDTAHDEIVAATRGFEAEERAYTAARRDGWPEARLAVMAALLRDKFRRHPEIAATLSATGDARILYSDSGSRYWRNPGTNWVGRLLELIRSELAADGLGLDES
jgi:predicted NAD-dependent protein-ADP-ribosyltransferase YbiA (DUF1768 family)